MRVLATFMACSALCASALAQKPALTTEQTLEQMIDTALFGCCYDGWVVKQARRLGDSTAVILTRVLTDRDLGPQQIETATLILEGAFSEPSQIESPFDREPKTTLFVLRYLGLCTEDGVLKERLSDARRHILARIGTRPPASKP